VTQDGAEALRGLRAPDSPQLAILDWMMPGLTGPQVCQELRSSSLTRSVYAILLTAKEGTESIVEGLEAGADDFVNKPFDRGELKARLHVGTRVIQLRQDLSDRMHELEEANRKLHDLSSLDDLTGIPNRRHFDTDLDREWRRAHRAGNPLALIMIDIDYFKNYNDTYGHLGGDECLMRVAGCLKECARRGSDLVARYGGEEFVVLLPEVRIEGAAILAERMRSAVDALAIPHSASRTADHVTISLGAAERFSAQAEPPEPGDKPDPASTSSPATLIEAADKALYEAKHNGRNRVCKG
jgi:diguanylate cyclase (GGDEF)-like protein